MQPLNHRSHQAMYLTQVCERWIYTACLCFGLDLKEQSAAAFATATRSSRLSTPRNLLFTVGDQMDQVFDWAVDRT